MSGTINADTIVGSTKTVSVNTLQQASDVATAVNNRSGSAGAFSFRNKIVDGRFDFWYEGTSQTTNGYGSSTMWQSTNGTSTKVYSQQSLTIGVDLPNIDVPTALYYSRTVVTSVVNAGSYITLQQQIENVKTLAGKPAMLSFYARSDAARNIAVELYQHIDSTATTDVSIPGGLVALTTSWKKYTVPFTVSSLAGKTISAVPDYLRLLFWFDAGSSLSSRTSGLGQQSGTFDIACVQLEEGSVATPFEELPLSVSEKQVWRYYEKGTQFACGYAGSAGSSVGSTVKYASQKRAEPTLGTTIYGPTNCSTILITNADQLQFSPFIQAPATGFAQFWAVWTADARL